MRIRGVDGPVGITFDELDRPTIQAETAEDGAFGLGYVVARDRRLQMEVLRRKSHGTLAAVAGPGALDSDIRQRRLGLADVARRCYAQLPARQRRMLDAFAGGASTSVPDRPWTGLDSIAVAQLMFQAMASDGSEIRMVEVMRRTLAPEVVRFLLAGHDEFGTEVDGASSEAPELSPPHEPLAALMAEPPPEGPRRVVVTDSRPVGSNAWAVSRSGSAILANDMHLELTCPSVWYAARIVVGDLTVTGVTLPGLPILVAGSNGAIAWGFTRLPADTVDLVEVDPGEHTVRRETIAVAGEPDVVIEVRETRWGPITGELQGRPVAFRSTLRDPGAIDFGIERIYRARTVGEAVTILNDSGLPPLNAVLAGADGTVAWTVSGRFRCRATRGPRGFSPADDSAMGSGDWLPPDQLPKVIAPSSGCVVSCNNGHALMHDSGIAWNLFGGWRARRVAALLAQGAGRDEASAFRMQLDVDAGLFRYYRELALRHLPAGRAPDRLRSLREEVAAWNGTADRAEHGLALLVVFRDLLREELFAAVTRPCQRYDPDFTFCYHGHEAALRRLLEALDEGLVPAPWLSASRFVMAQLLLARMLLTERSGSEASVRWGEFNRLALTVLPGADPPARELAVVELSGCAESVCVAQPHFGASMRFVVDPARPDDGLLSIPGSPSGTGLANVEHLRAWAAGCPRPLVGGGSGGERRSVEDLQAR